LQVTGNFLMKTIRRRSHVKIALDQLIPRPGFRQELVILDGKRREIRVHRHPQLVRSIVTTFNVWLHSETLVAAPKNFDGILRELRNSGPRTIRQRLPVTMPNVVNRGSPARTSTTSGVLVIFDWKFGAADAPKTKSPKPCLRAKIDHRSVVGLTFLARIDQF
jgi:hypothetical protein